MCSKNVKHKENFAAIFKVVDISEVVTLELIRLDQRIKLDIKNFKCIDDHYSTLNDDQISGICLKTIKKQMLAFSPSQCNRNSTNFKRIRFKTN